MGQQKSTQTTTIPGAGNQEQDLMNMLAKLSKQFGGQMGNLSDLANGNVGAPTEADTNLVNQSIGATTDIAQRDLQRQLGPMMAKLTEQGTELGSPGSSMDQLNRILASREISSRLSDVASNAQKEGAQSLMNLPFQRAELKLGANAQLFNQLTGASNPVLANALQSRMANQTTTMKKPMDWSQLAKYGAAIGGMPFTGGASAAGLFADGMPGQV
jgi:hypothetical protein